MPKGQYERKPKPDEPDLAALEARIADLERRLEAANDYFRRGYVPPSV
jgi:hypothetical protein